jgi:hypothetical protein
VKDVKLIVHIKLVIVAVRAPLQIAVFSVYVMPSL